MSDELTSDDSSHYEISLTAGQAFIAFVLLLFSLAAAFAFGLIIGRGQGDDRLVVRREPAVISEGTAAEEAQIVELDRNPPAAELALQPPDPIIIDEGAGEPAPAGEIIEPAPSTPAVTPVQPPATATQTPTAPAASTGPVLAQVLSSSDARAAEGLAAKLIESGFQTAYVERVPGNDGMIYRVRVRFGTEQEARAAADRLRAIARSEPWITRP